MKRRIDDTGFLLEVTEHYSGEFTASRLPLQLAYPGPALCTRDPSTRFDFEKQNRTMEALAYLIGETKR